jgi:hypothetical protein
MPNWVFNNVSITGPEEDVQRLKAQVGAAYTQKATVWDAATSSHVVREIENTDVFSFWNIVRPPEDKMDLYHAVSDNKADGKWGWYGWNNANWGTKWDASDVGMEEYASDHISYRFSTAWGVPMEALVNLSDQYPTVTLENEWQEEQGFGGTLSYIAGEVTVLDEYDIPSTHEEQISRNDYCYCENEEDPEDFPFEDCPRDDNPLGISPREVEQEASV